MSTCGSVAATLRAQLVLRHQRNALPSVVGVVRSTAVSGKYLYVRDVVEVSDGLAIDTIRQLLQPVALAYGLVSWTDEPVRFLKTGALTASDHDLTATLAHLPSAFVHSPPYTF